MKKILSFMLSIAILFSMLLVFSLNAAAAFPTSDAMDGYENLCLTYTFNNSRSDKGRHSASDLLPYVAYCDSNGNIKDFFFDSYLFLPCVGNGPSGARIHYDENNPTKAVDWIAYVEDTFYEGTNVNALETAFGQAKSALNAPDKKAGVFLSILYPGKAAGANFGSLGGKSLDFTNIEDRKFAIKWIIDEQVRLYNEAGYENLDLAGFYWLEEYLAGGANTAEDKLLFKYASDYLHSLGLKFIWIPWYQANGYKIWRELGFDTVCMQPNMYWMAQADKNRMSDCIKECNTYGMGVEMEMDQRALSNAEYYNRYLDYLESCMQTGAMESIKMYYQDGKTAVLYNACYSSDKRARSVYDLTYKYAKGTLTASDIDSNRSKEFALSEDVDWISIGKSYTATEPYSDGGSMGYQKNDGKELTDGILGSSELDTDWHAFHSTLLDEDKRMSVTIDLGTVRNDLTHFMIQFSHLENYGIDDPFDDVRIYLSEDGEKFNLLVSPDLEYMDMSSYIEYVCEPKTARYVKYSFINSNANFVFCGEALVGVDKQLQNDQETPSDESDSQSDVVSDTETETDTETSTSDDVDLDMNDDGSDKHNDGSDKKNDTSWVNWLIWSGIIVVGIGIIVSSVIIIRKKKNTNK